MNISITDFGGMVPKLNPERLPDGCAQEAHNCDVTSGALAPIEVEGQFVTMHEADNTMKSGILASDVVQITKPTAPSLGALTYMADPSDWLNIHATDWVSYIDQSSGSRIVTRVRAQNLRIVWGGYSEVDVYIVVYLPIRIYTFSFGGPYFLKGPRYQFVFQSAANGPDQFIAFPWAVSEGDPEFSSMRVPLVDPNSQIYAYFEVADVSGPKYDEDILVTDYPFVTWAVPGSYVLFRINMNYAEPQRKHLYYVSAVMDRLDDEAREGPPSEISGKIVQKPGQQLILNTPIPQHYGRLKLYRAGTTNADDFRLIDDEVRANTYTDWKESTSEPIPPYGNYPGEDRPAFLRGSVMHPAHFGVALWGQQLYFSDQYRPHAWPEEYVLPFPGAKAIALTGNSVLVFCDSVDTNEWPAVYSVYGGNPAAMGKQLLSNNHPLLNVAGLCRLGDTIYWPTHDGLAACKGGAPEIITAEHYTRKQWAALDPEHMVARTADNSIFLEYPDSSSQLNLRFDIDEKLSAVTTYSALSGVDYTWHSKRYYFDQPTIIDYVRVVADDTVRLKVYADRVLVQTVQVTTDEPIALAGFARTGSTRSPGFIGGPGGGLPGGGGGSTPTLKHAREWSFAVDGDAVVRRIEAFERVIHDVTDEIRLTSENTPVWRSTWARFGDAQRWAVVQVNTQTTMPVTVRLYADGALAHQQVINNGVAFGLPRTIPRANLWTIDVESPVRIDSLYATRRKTVDAGDGIREINDGPYPPWLAKRYKFTDSRRVTSVLVHAAGPVNMNLYYDSAIEPSETIAIADSTETKVTLGQYSSVAWDFDGRDADVLEVIVFVARVQPVGQDGISLVNPPSTRGLLFKFVDCAQLAVGSIGATDYTTLRVTLKADGVTVWAAQRVTSGKAFALPRTLPEASLWEVDITGGGEIHNVVFLARRPELLQGRTVFEAHPKNIPGWMYKRYTFALGATRLISAWVEASATVRMRLYIDGATGVTKTVTLPTRVETLVEIPNDCTTVDFDFNGDDARVVELGLFGKVVENGTLDGVQAGPRQNWRKIAWRFPDRADIACVIVGARSYTNVRIKLLADGALALNASVANGRIIKMLRTRQDASLWEADLTAPHIGVLESLILMPRRSVQAGGTLQRTRTGGIPSWLYERYEYSDRQRIRSVVVDADSYPVTMRLYYDHSTGVSEVVTISNARERLVASTLSHGCLEFDFLDDGAVRDVSILPVTEELIGPEGIVLQNPTSWRGLSRKFADQGSFAAGSVGASEYPVTLTLTYTDANGQTQTAFNGPVAGGGMFLLPRSLPRASRWGIDIDAGAGILHSLVLIPWQRVDAGAAIRETRPEIGLAPWLYRIYQFTDQAWPGALIVHADEYPVTLRLFIDGATSPSTEVTVLDANEIRLAGLDTVNEVRFDFDGSDTAVREVIFFTKVVQDGAGTVNIPGPSFRRNLVRFAEANAFACGLVTISDEAGILDGTVPLAHVHLYADGVKVHTETIRGAGVFLLPTTLARARVWEIDVETSSNVTGVTLVPWQRVAASAAVLEGLNATGQIPAWLYTEFELTTPFKGKSAIVHSERDVPLDLYVDGVHKRYMLTAGRETHFNEACPEGRTVRFRFDGKERYIRAVRIFREEVMPVENGGVVLRPAQGMAAWRNKVLEFKDTGSWRVGRVVASQYPVTVRLYRGTVAVDEIEVMDGRPLKFAPNLPNGKQWGLDVETAGDVHELVLIARDTMVLTNGAIRITKGEDPFAWIGKRVLSSRPINLAACRVNASAYPVKVTFYDGDKLGADPVTADHASPIVEVLAHDGRPFRLPRTRPERLLEIDFVAADGEAVAIYDVAVGMSMDAVR